MHGDLSNIFSIHHDLTAGHIIETWNQVHQCRLPTSGTADNRRSLSRFCHKIYIMKHICFRTWIPEAHMLKTYTAGMLIQILRLLSVLNRGLGTNHLINSFCSHCSTRKHNRHHRQHQERHDDHHRICNKGCHSPHLHGTAINLMSSKPYNSHCKHIHDHHHSRHHKGHHTVGKQIGSGQLLICFIKTFFFFLLADKRPDYRQSGQDLPGYQIQIIYQLLHQLELRHSYTHQHHHIAENNQNRQNNNPFHSCPCLHHLQDTTNSKDRCICNHTKQ